MQDVLFDWKPQAQQINAPHVWGWNEDLTAVPDFDLSASTGCPAAQAAAGFSVQSGALVFDSDLVIAAGGTYPVSVHAAIQCKFAPDVLLMSRHHVSTLGSNNQSLFLFHIFDPSGVRTVPTGGIQNYSYLQLRNDGGGTFKIFGDATALPGLGAYSAGYMRLARIGNSAGSMSTAFTTTSGYAVQNSISASGPRSWTDGPIPDGWWFKALLRFEQISANEQIYREIPQFQIFGQQVT